MKRHYYYISYKVGFNTYLLPKEKFSTLDLAEERRKELQKFNNKKLEVTLI